MLRGGGVGRDGLGGFREREGAGGNGVESEEKESDHFLLFMAVCEMQCQLWIACDVACHVHVSQAAQQDMKLNEMGLSR